MNLNSSIYPGFFEDLPNDERLPMESEKLNIKEGSLETRSSIACWFNFPKKSIFPANENAVSRKANKNLETPSKRWGHSSVIHNNNMYIFGGRNSCRNLANIYAFNLENFFWYKIEPIGQVPLARDSHSAILVISYFD